MATVQDLANRPMGPREHLKRVGRGGLLVCLSFNLLWVLMLVEAWVPTAPDIENATPYVALICAIVAPGILAASSGRRHRFWHGLWSGVVGWPAALISSIFLVAMMIQLLPDQQNLSPQMGQGLGVAALALCLLGLFASPITGAIAWAVGIGYDRFGRSNPIATSEREDRDASV